MFETVARVGLGKASDNPCADHFGGQVGHASVFNQPFRLMLIIPRHD